MAAVSETSPRTATKTCGNCACRKSRVCLSLKLLKACNQISKNPERISALTVATLIEETETLRRRKFKCGKEQDVWTHLMDKACAFWQPTEDWSLSS